MVGLSESARLTGNFSCSGVPKAKAFQLSRWNLSGALTACPARGSSWLLEEKSSLKTCVRQSRVEV